jgi:hypothetical protein
MFDFEEKISEWRKQMLAGGIKTPAPLEELEIHLREDIEKQMQSGLSEQAAFYSAVQKIGQGQVVQTEFEKVEEIKMTGEQRLRERGLMIFSILIPLILGGTVLRNQESAMTSAEQMSSFAAIAIFSLLIWGGRLGYGIFPAIRAKRIRDGILYSCCVPMMLWWIIFLRVIVPRYDFTMGQFMVAFSWGFLVPAGVCLGLVWGIEAAARKKAAMTGS